MAKEIMQKSIDTKKHFSYQKGSVSLDFKLSVDHSSELRAFLSCLIAAQADIEDIIKDMKN